MLRVYNTLSQKKEIFRPRENKKVNLFVCGPTVYDFSHIGHARTYIAFDMIAKYLKEKGYKVFYLQNITDIDDKIIKRAKEKNITPKQLARKFEKEYYKDMKALGITSVSKYARATDYIQEIINQVKKLIEKGIAYRINDGIYYDITKFKDYGKLSRRTVLQAEDAVSRIDEAKEKRNKGDFCLWKFSKPGEPKWKSPWGWGRPGWHIEDTAITQKHFGYQYDIHGGARDLIFPHHEAEIAQMEAISGKKPMAKYWLHTGFLTVKGKKMSKSLGNFITIREFLKHNSPQILRMLVLKNHYRSPIDYSEKEINQAKKELQRIAELVGKLKDIASSKKKEKKDLGRLKKLIQKTKKDFEKKMDNDFNTPEALAVIFGFVNKINTLISKNKLKKEDAKKILDLFGWFDKILGIGLTKAHYRVRLSENIKLKDLVEKRERLRKERKWKEADKIRERIKKLGYIIEDTKEGPRLKKID
ncbi:cysteine--tRNA ligase [bacterium]|nr:cysteine--tRNA ligase [bacterium]